MVKVRDNAGKKTKLKSSKSRGASSEKRNNVSTRTKKTTIAKGAVKKKVNGPSFLIYTWRLGKYVSLVSVTAVLIWGVDWTSLGRRVEALANRPVANIAVKGEFNYLAKQHVQSLVMEHISGNFVNVDLAGLRANLQNHPWVKSASVQRVWPDGLSIDVVEEKPIARWGRGGFINNEGRIIEVGLSEALVDLPLFSGPEEQNQQITRTYLDMTEILASRNIGILGITVDETLSWKMLMDNNIEIAFGQYEVLAKLRNFILVYEQKLAGLSSTIARVDMRYESGMAVAWRDSNSVELQASR